MARAASPPVTSPALVIVIPLEGSLRTYIRAERADAERLTSWIASHPQLREIARLAFEADEELSRGTPA